MNITMRIRAMQKIIDKQNDLIELLYKAEQQVLAFAPGFKYGPCMTIDIDNARKEIAELKEKLYA